MVRKLSFTVSNMDSLLPLSSFASNRCQVLSLETDRTNLSSGLKATLVTVSVCPASGCPTSLKVLVSYTRTTACSGEVALHAVAINLREGETARVIDWGVVCICLSAWSRQKYVETNLIAVAEYFLYFGPQCGPSKFTFKRPPFEWSQNRCYGGTYPIVSQCLSNCAYMHPHHPQRPCSISQVEEHLHRPAGSPRS